MFSTTHFLAPLVQAPANLFPWLGWSSGLAPVIVIVVLTLPVPVQFIQCHLMGRWRNARRHWRNRCMCIDILSDGWLVLVCTRVIMFTRCSGKVVKKCSFVDLRYFMWLCFTLFYVVLCCMMIVCFALILLVLHCLALLCLAWCWVAIACRDLVCLIDLAVRQTVCRTDVRRASGMLKYTCGLSFTFSLT